MTKKPKGIKVYPACKVKELILGLTKPELYEANTELDHPPPVSTTTPDLDGRFYLLRKA